MATAVFVCSSLGAPVLPDSPPPANAPLNLASGTSSATLTAGAPVTVQGSGFKPNANITIGLYSSPTTLDALTADATGSFSDSVTIPSSFTGSHTLVAAGLAPDGSARVLESPVTVQSAASGTLPFTGIKTALYILSGLGLILSGFVLIRVAALSRRRRVNAARAEA